MLRQVTTGQVKTENSMRHRITLVNRHSVRNTVTRVQHNTCRTTRGVQGENSLNSHVEGWRVERFEHDLRHLLTVGLRVQRSFSEQHRVFFWCYTEFIVERVVPDLLHVIPVRHNTMFNWVLEREDTTL